ncbi:MAG TPA: hypothetical protein VJK48_06625, partial [Chlamydiales bacterium]|nr:hypothetical protein [Chlamydiales bacterium]
MVDDLLISPGLPAPLGYSKNEKGGNFSLFASHATEVILGLRKNGQIREIPLVQTGPIWHIGIAGDLKNYHYAFRIDGLSDPQKALFFDPHLWLQDPFSRFPVTESLPWGNSRND